AGGGGLPARFQLSGAPTPCPWAPPRFVDFICARGGRRRYLGKLSGPLMDRIDIWMQMHPMSTAGLAAAESEDSATVRTRVTAARAAAAARWRELGWRTNGEVPGHVLRRQFPLPADSTAPVEAALRLGRISARGADRALRVAWTVCDLRGGDVPTAHDVMQALNFRQRGTQ
ncbi:ATP-binding protein, partial [Nocardia carnea]|uniref:magnesium chelatase subunit ChlI family protein n=1 Tax=Nocardia carnea TaxID=37328 RepID=UPI002455EFDB